MTEQTTSAPLPEQLSGACEPGARGVTIFARRSGIFPVGRIHPMRFFLPFGPLLRGWLFSFLGWGLWAFVLGWQLARFTPIPQADVVRIVVRDWLPWALLTPLLFRLVTRLPLEGYRWKISLPVHLALCATILYLLGTWSALIGPFPGSWRSGSRGPGSASSMSRSSESRPRENAAPASAQPAPASAPPSPASGVPGRPASTSGTSGPARTWPSRPSGPHRRPFGLFGFGDVQLPIYCAILSVAHALHFYRRSQDRERRSLELSASLAQARLAALRMQLQPHFLFNALNAIAALVHKNPDAADEMISALGDLLRLTLESSSEQELPLRRELQLVERYLAIEHIRFDDRLQVHYDIPSETEGALVPTLLLQPIVENAVKHGLEPEREPGTLTIRARREGNQLALSVIDTGRGLRPQTPTREGIGLANTRARLRELYGDGARLDLQDSGGVTVSIVLPFREAA